MSDERLQAVIVNLANELWLAGYHDAVIELLYLALKNKYITSNLYAQIVRGCKQDEVAAQGIIRKGN